MPVGAVAVAEGGIRCNVATRIRDIQGRKGVEGGNTGNVVVPVVQGGSDLCHSQADNLRRSIVVLEGGNQEVGDPATRSRSPEGNDQGYTYVGGGGGGGEGVGEEVLDIPVLDRTRGLRMVGKVQGASLGRVEVFAEQKSLRLAKVDLGVKILLLG